MSRQWRKHQASRQALMWQTQLIGQDWEGLRNTKILGVS